MKTTSVERRFGPKRADHPTFGRPCPLCGIAFGVGDYTTLIPTEPADKEEREKMEAGRPYNAVALEVHWTCGHYFDRLVAKDPATPALGAAPTGRGETQ